MMGFKRIDAASESVMSVPYTWKLTCGYSILMPSPALGRLFTKASKTSGDVPSLVDMVYGFVVAAALLDEIELLPVEEDDRLVVGVVCVVGSGVDWTSVDSGVGDVSGVGVASDTSFAKSAKSFRPSPIPMPLVIASVYPSRVLPLARFRFDPRRGSIFLIVPPRSKMSKDVFLKRFKMFPPLSISESPMAPKVPPISAAATIHMLA